MIVSNGIDIVSVNSLKNVSNYKKIFTSNELEYFESHKSIQTKAGVYAAKEAVLKSLGVALNVYSLLLIEVVHINYKPFLKFYGELNEYIKKEGLEFSLSISHDEDYAVASVICYKVN